MSYYFILLYIYIYFLKVLLETNKLTNIILIINNKTILTQYYHFLHIG